MTNKTKTNQQENSSFSNRLANKDGKLNEVTATEEKTSPLNDNQEKNIKLPNFIAMESTIGVAVILAIKSPTHKYLFNADLEWSLMPAINLKQFVIFRGQKNEPIAFVSFAFINDEVEQRLLTSSPKLRPQDWKSGNKAYIVDIISPFNIGKEILTKLNENQFKDKEIHLIQPRKDGKTLESKLLSEVVSGFSNIKQ